MQSFAKPWLSVTLAAALSIPVAGNAVPIIGNLTGSGSSGTEIGNDVRKAAGFTMGVGSYSIDNIVLRLKNDGSSSGDDPLANVSIWSNSLNNLPGSSLVVLNRLISGNIINNEISSPAADNYTFTPVSQYILQAGQKYWLVLSDDRNITDNLEWVSDGNPIGSYATSNGYLYSDNNGAVGSWDSSTIRNQYQINGTAISSVPYSASMWQGLTVVLLGGYMMVSLNRKRVYQK